MKNNKGNILLKAVIALITILIILSLCFLAYLYFQEINLAKVEPKNIIATLEQLEEYTNHSNTHNEQETNIVKPIIDEQEPAINNEQQIKNIADHYYYSQLDNNGKIIYAGLYSNKENLKSGNYKIDFGTEFNELLNQTDGEAKLSIAFQSAWDAFSYDNADVFYIDVDKVLLITESRTSWGKTTYNVVICAGEQNYLIDTFKDEEEVNIAEDYIENISNKIVSALQGYSDYDKSTNKFSFDPTKWGYFLINGVDSPLPKFISSNVCTTNNYGIQRNYRQYACSNMGTNDTNHFCNIPIIIKGTKTQETGSTNDSRPVFYSVGFIGLSNVKYNIGISSTQHWSNPLPNDAITYYKYLCLEEYDPNDLSLFNGRISTTSTNSYFMINSTKNAKLLP